MNLDWLPKSVDELNYVQLGMGAIVGLMAGFGGMAVLNGIGNNDAPLPMGPPDDGSPGNGAPKADELASLLAALTAKNDADELFTSASLVLRQRLKCEYSALYLRDESVNVREKGSREKHNPELDAFVCVSGETFSLDSRAQLKLNGKDGVVAYMRDRNCLVHLGKGDRQLSMFRHLPEAIQEVIFMPLRTGSDLFGVMLAANKVEYGVFSKQDLEMVSYLAVPFSLAISNAISASASHKNTVECLISFNRACEAAASETNGHSDRVAELAVKIGRELRMSEGELENLKRAALLHDLGKWLLPPALRFVGTLPNGPEKDVIRFQSRHIVDILRPLGFLDRALPLILNHHERYDGSGFPNGLRGPAIPSGAMVVAIAETFDLLTHDVPGKPALSVNEARSNIVGASGTRFDPTVARVLIQIIDRDYAS